MHKITLAALLLSTSTWAFAHNITENTVLPAVTINDKGELLYDTTKDKFSYQIGIVVCSVEKYVLFSI